MGPSSLRNDEHTPTASAKLAGQPLSPTQVSCRLIGAINTKRTWPPYTPRRRLAHELYLPFYPRNNTPSLPSPSRPPTSPPPPVSKSCLSFYLSIRVSTEHVCIRCLCRGTNNFVTKVRQAKVDSKKKKKRATTEEQRPWL